MGTIQMRDIRDDLTERLSAAEDERAKLSARVKQLENYMTTVISMIDSEKARWDDSENEHRVAAGHPSLKPLSEIFPVSGNVAVKR
ncbi:MAG: hypothetical protein ACR2PO_15975 [Methyloligellaceae bacterium]